MSNRIFKQEELNTITPANIRNYLSKYPELRFVAPWNDVGNVYSLGDEEFFIPEQMDLRDYARDILDIVKALGRIENRTPEQVLADLKNKEDVIRFRCHDENVQDGKMSFSKCVDFVSGARELIMAAACSAATHKISYSSRKPADAEQFMERVQMGQTEIGSFIIVAHTPVEPVLFSDDCDAPYTNSVIPLLKHALEISLEAYRNSDMDRSMDFFSRSSSDGISTNLLDAIAKMNDSAPGGTFDVSISSSIRRRQNISTQKPISFCREHGNVFKQASGIIKLTEPEYDYSVCGPVIDMHREHNDLAGDVVILDLSNRPNRKVTVHLIDKDYDKAAEVHKNRDYIRISGTLKTKRKQTAMLEKTSELEIISELDFEK